MILFRYMDTAQNSTITKNKPNDTANAVTDPRHQAVIDYRALNGLITSDDGIKKMTVDEFATTIGTTRRQVYRWQDSIPDFWTKVADRRMEIAPKARLSRVHETWYLKAVKGDYQHMQLWLANFDPNFRMPTEKMEHDIGSGMADLVANLRRNEQPERKIIDAEISDPKPE